MDPRTSIAHSPISTTQVLFVVAVALFTAVAAVTDLRIRKLPNWLTVTGLLLGVVFHAVTAGRSGLATSLAGFATGFGILLVLWLIGGGGGGDVKLMGALGAWLGARLTLYVFLLSTLFAVLLSAGLLAVGVARRGYGRVRRKHFAAARLDVSPAPAETAHKTQRRLLPYALPVALGTWVVLLWQVVMHRP